MYGPVQTGLSLMPLGPTLAYYSFGYITTGPARYSIAAGNGFFVLMRTLYWSILSAPAIQLTFCCVVDLFSGLDTKLSVYTTSSASKGSPLWNFTPRRRSNSSVVSLTQRQPVASEGLYSLVFGSRKTSVSQI